MNRSIFDSEEEKKLYKKLKSRWSKYVEVYPQIPVKNVIGYRQIKSFDMPKKAIEYLLKAAFDIVVCELHTAVPILAVEFDGIGQGFSQDLQYISKVVPLNDPYRKLKIERKLEACFLSDIPIVVISFEESELLKQSRDMLMVIDAIIGRALEHQYYKKNYSYHSQKLSEAFERGGTDASDMYFVEMTIRAEQANPIKRKTKEIVEKFPFWQEQIIFPTKKGDRIEGRFSLFSEIERRDDKLKRKVLAFVDIAMRDVNFYSCNDWEIFNSIGEYCLARKIEEEVGTDLKAWQHLIEKAEWV
ncbi:MAG TPA: DUF2726 domain-containing protein [Thermodesulfobacteriota bacterium]|nr:DUF2726 domain-containing protein [Thermodesulfobacteriota bacterium]